MNIDTKQYTEDMRRQWTDATIRENNSTGKTYAIYNTDQNYYVTKTRTSHMTYKTRWPHILLPIVNHTSAKCRWQSPSSLSANLWMCDKK